MNLVIDAFDWLRDPEHWSGPAGIVTRTLEHIGLTFAAVAVAALLALPAGVIIGHLRRGEGVVGGITGAARAIPTLGVLTLFGLWLGIGVKAPLIALVILAMPSLLAGAYAGVAAIDPQIPSAAKAIGMNTRQVIWRVELPLALPVLVGGIRAAVLQVVATATFAAYTADVGLGRYLFAGLKTRDYGQMLGGAILVAVLALLLELILAYAQGRAEKLARPASTAISAKSL